MLKKPKISTNAKEQQKEQPRFFKAPRGMHDILPSDRPYWDAVESAVKKTAETYSFSKIETPVLESADLFIRTSGEEADVVAKEMYTLKTKGGDVLALRPEFTAPKARAYLEHGLSRMGQPQRLWSMGSAFRHDRPQLGRFRQFRQADFDIIGGLNDPIYDALIISIIVNILKVINIGNSALVINSVGCRVCRPNYLKQLGGFYKGAEKKLCEDCVKRTESENFLRLLDCKNEDCKKFGEKAPNFLDKLCATCNSHFKGVLEYLDEVEIPYTIDHRLVRGLDYYSRTVFEIFAAGAENLGAIASGGRYDYLMEMIGGHLTPAVGGSLGMERAIAVMRLREIKLPKRAAKKVFVAHAGESAKKKVLKLMSDLRGQGIVMSEALSKDSLRAQLKAADKEGASLVLIIGQKEIYEKSVIFRDMKSGLQESVKLDKLAGEIKKRLK